MIVIHQISKELCYLYTQKWTTFGTTIFFLLQQKNKVRGGERE
jgi:hypothetical protein